MLSVVLMILKIIGIVLLSILGLLLLILLLVLLVPVRYKGRVSKDEIIDADAHATWLLHLVHFIFSYHDGEMVKKLKILGITFKNDVTGKDEYQEEDTDYSEEDNDNPIKDAGVTDVASRTEEVLDNTGISDPQTDKGSANETVNPQTPEGKNPAGEQTAKKEPAEKNSAEKQPDENDGEKKTFAQRKTEVVEKIKNIYNKITHYKEIVTDPRVKNGVGYAKKKLFEILRHILPKKLRMDADYGFEDPATTGYVTAVIAALYGKLGNVVKARPDFENEVLCGKAELSGRIRLGTVLFKSLQVILKKDCRYVYKLIKAEREK